jgi:hypothetical protein
MKDGYYFLDDRNGRLYFTAAPTIQRIICAPRLPDPAKVIAKRRGLKADFVAARLIPISIWDKRKITREHTLQACAALNREKDRR